MVKTLCKIWVLAFTGRLKVEERTHRERCLFFVQSTNALEYANSYWRKTENGIRFELKREWITEYGEPTTICVIEACDYTTRELYDPCQQENIKQKMTSSYHLTAHTTVTSSFTGVRTSCGRKSENFPLFGANSLTGDLHADISRPEFLIHSVSIRLSHALYAKTADYFRDITHNLHIRTWILHLLAEKITRCAQEIPKCEWFGYTCAVLFNHQLTCCSHDHSILFIPKRCEIVHTVPCEKLHDGNRTSP